MRAFCLMLYELASVNKSIVWRMKIDFRTVFLTIVLFSFRNGSWISNLEILHFNSTQKVACAKALSARAIFPWWYILIYQFYYILFPSAAKAYNILVQKIVKKILTKCTLKTYPYLIMETLPFCGLSLPSSLGLPIEWMWNRQFLFSADFCALVMLKAKKSVLRLNGCAKKLKYWFRIHTRNLNREKDQLKGLNLFHS